MAAYPQAFGAMAANPQAFMALAANRRRWRPSLATPQAFKSLAMQPSFQALVIQRLVRCGGCRARISRTR